MYARLVQKHRISKLTKIVYNQVYQKTTINQLRMIPPTNNSFMKELVNKYFKRTIISISTDETAFPNLVDIKRFLKSHKLEFKQQYACLQINCPICQHDMTRLKLDAKCFINMRTGSFLCHSCKSSGSWELFQEIIFKLEKDGLVGDEFSKYGPTEAESDHCLSTLRKALRVEELPQEDYLQLQKNFNIMPITQSTLAKLNIHTNKIMDTLITPIYAMDNSLLGLHYSKKDMNIQLVEPKSCWFPIGWKMHRQELVLTSSLVDFLAIKQAVNCSCLLLPHGIQWLPPETLPLLESVDKIILWLGGDLNAWNAAKTFSKKLNASRCFYIRPSKVDGLRPFDALQAKMNLRKILSQASPVNHKSITSFESLREDVRSELIENEQVLGVQWNKFSPLNKLLKGHRRGELTVFTGPTGSGKTTFISDYSLDLCGQGVSTLWGSFEIQNIRLAKLMLQQFAQVNLEENLEKYDELANKFERLPLYFMTLHGQNTITSVLEAMNHAVYVYDIGHVIVDNLQFMMGTPFESKGNIDRFYQQDLIVGAFRKFATLSNCHVTLVVHPRKEKNPWDLNMSSIFGGAKATQEADNVLILQDKRLSSIKGKKFIQIAKNRYSGDLGLMPIEFDRECTSFIATSKK